jgi:3-hydroxyisobutyrate dehydrogenase
MAQIAFIGLGNMGAGMSANLAKAQHRVAAFDLSEAALAAAAGEGCTPCASVAEAVRDAEAVITMLPTAADVSRLFESEVLPNARKDALLVDCSTIDVQSARDLAAAAAKAGRIFADAPVSGGIMAANAGTLAFMVGCEEADFSRIEPFLAPMGRAVIHAGGPGAGQAAKICNNMVLGVSMLGVCEAFALAEKLDLAPEKFFEIASQSSAQCWSLTTYCPWPGPVAEAPSNRDYQGGFLTRLMLKDLKLAQEAAAKAGAATPLGAQAEALFALFDRLGYGGRDFSAILQLLRGKLADLG